MNKTVLFSPISFDSAQKLLIASLLLCIFLNIIWETIEYTRSASSKHFEESVEKLKKTITNIKRECIPANYYKRILKRICNLLTIGVQPEKVFQKFAKQEVKIFCFNQSGKRIQFPGATTGFTYASEKCFKMIVQLKQNQLLDLSKNDLTIAESFLGSKEAPLQLARSFGRIVDMSSYGIPKLIAVTSVKPKNRDIFFLLFIIDFSNINTLELIKRNLNHIARRVPYDFKYGVIDLARKESDYYYNTMNVSPEIRDSIISGPTKTEITIRNQILVSELIDRRFKLFGLIDVAQHDNFFKKWHNIVLAFLLWLLTFIVIEKLLKKLYISILFQVLIIFGLAGASSIAILFRYAQVYKTTLRESLVRENVSKSAGILEKIDYHFSTFLKNQEVKLKKIMKLWNNPTQDLPKVINRLKNLAKAKNHISIHLIDQNGKILFKHEPKIWYSLKEYWGLNRQKMVSMCGKLAIEFFNSPETNPYTETTIKSLEENVLRGMASEFALARGTVGQFSFGKKKLMTFFDFAVKNNGQAFGALLLTFENEFLEKIFLKSYWKTLSKSQNYKQVNFAALRKEESQSNKEIFGKRTSKQLVELSLSINQTRAVDSKFAEYHGQASLYVGFPGKKLEGLNLFLINPLKPLEDKVKSIDRWFSMLSLAIIIFVTGLSLFFSQIILNPLSEISTSVRELINGRFTNFPNINSGDTLQEIGHGIRDIMCEMQEFTTAIEVQEQLIPVKPLENAKGLCYGWRHSPGAFIEELYDYFYYDNDKIGIILSNLHGRKTTSALLLAMIKMFARISFQESDFSLSKLVYSLYSGVGSKLADFPDACILFATFDWSSGEFEAIFKGTFSLSIISQTEQTYKILKEQQPKQLKLKLATKSNLIIGTGEILKDANSVQQILDKVSNKLLNLHIPPDYASSTNTLKQIEFNPNYNQAFLVIHYTESTNDKTQI